MPHKFNDARWHKFDKKRYRITNWPAYNESLRQRGDVTICTHQRKDGVAGEQRIQSAQSRRNANGPLEDDHWPQTESAQLS